MLESASMDNACASKDLRVRIAPSSRGHTAACETVSAVACVGVAGAIAASRSGASTARWVRV